MFDKRETVTVALTQTINAYPHMPDRVEQLPQLAGQLEAIRQANVDHHEMLIRKAAARGAQICSLGELFTGPYFALTQLEMWCGLAESAEDGPTVRQLGRLAAELGVVISAPLYEQEPETGERFNTAVIIDADGEVRGKYRKTHVPNGSNERASFWETYYYAPSTGLAAQHAAGQTGGNAYFPVFETRYGRIGVAICYDRHFDGAMFSLAREGAQLILVPAVTFGATSERMWEREFEVDACRHHVYIAGSNRFGAEAPWNTPYFGRSYVAGPYGRCKNTSDHPELVIAECDIGRLNDPDPSGWDLQRDCRDPIYTRRKAE